VDHIELPTSEPASPTENLTHHLTELRDRVVNCAIVVLVGAGISYYYSEILFRYIRRPIAAFLPSGGFVFLNPVDKFVSYVQVSITAGIVLTCPLWLYQVWKFIEPGLKENEKKYGLWFIFFGTFLFMVGLCFVYFLVLPMAFDFLLNFGGKEDKAMITISEYLSFFTTTMLIFGLMFEMPLVLTLLGIMGIIDKKFLKEKRRYAIVVLAVVAAVVTPPDVLSMFMLLIPMMFLYEVSIFTVGIFGDQSQSEIT